MFQNYSKKYNIDKSWEKLFLGEYDFDPIYVNNKARKDGKHEFPKEKDTFRFAEIPINDIKCVIVGMEPYASWYIDEKTKEIK